MNLTVVISTRVEPDRVNRSYSIVGIFKKLLPQLMDQSANIGGKGADQIVRVCKKMNVNKEFKKRTFRITSFTGSKFGHTLVSQENVSY